MSKNQNAEAKSILQSFYDGEINFVNEIEVLFKAEGAVIPLGFKENDVILSAPALFDDIYDVMYMRMMMKIATGIHAMHLTMCYRQDMISLYKKFSVSAEEKYEITTQFLLSKGVLPKSPSVSMPSQVEFVKEEDYKSGFKLFGHRRVLNTVEVSYIYQAIETNLTGLHLMIGFGQVANLQEVRAYFSRGKDLAKKIASKLGETLLDSDIVVPGTSTGHATNSVISPFSDKLMMYNSALLSSFGLGGAALGTSFSLRNDLLLKMGMIEKDTLDFALDGGTIMLKNGWMEEPPQMEDRTQLIGV